MLLRTALSAYTAHKVAESNANANADPNAPRPYYTAVEVPVTYAGRYGRRAFRRDLAYNSICPAPAQYYQYTAPQQPQVVYQVPPPPPPQVCYEYQQPYPPGPATRAVPQMNGSYPENYRNVEPRYRESPTPSDPRWEGHDGALAARAQAPPEPPSYQSSVSQRGSPGLWSEGNEKPARGQLK